VRPRGTGLPADDELVPAVVERRTTWVALAIGTAAIVFGGLLVAGVARAWDPLPFQDMWDGYVGFWYALSSGDVAAWWAQHNEHRIVLARLIFWLDFVLFQGAGWSLIVANLLATFAIAGLFIAALIGRLRESTGHTGPRLRFALVGIVIVAMSTSWLQQVNLVWGFQIQFFLAVLLPLAGACLLAAAGPTAPASNARYAGAVVLAVASVGTVASGLAAPFVATVQALAVRESWRRAAIMAVAGAVSAVLYLYGYVSPAGSANPIQSLSHPVRLATYVLRYMGAPAELITGSAVVGELAAVALLLVLAASAYGYVRNPDRPRFAAAMLAFVGYLVLGSIFTALGRINFGVGQAASGRYETPVLAAWTAVLVLYAPRIQGLRTWPGVIASVLLTGAAVVLLSVQLRVFRDQGPTLLEGHAATLAIALGIRDPQVIRYAFPTPDLPVDLGQRAMRDGLTVLGDAPWRNLASELGARLAVASPEACDVAIGAAQPVEGSGFTRLEGTVATRTAIAGRDGVLRILDGGDRTVGFGVLEEEAGSATAGRLIAYVLSPATSSPMHLGGTAASCSTGFELP
jgi:hypothetical protein